ncbi:PadR family transcriptional regulator [Ornithinimicrobium flavum]|uniref:PadR family transcriptional regulator n=1 Tax=Ornithinimicrobium flavum TaxID=1288636 RepID=UPI0010701448|nr:PadR family transcriptional regulator [Ornithinimicrobium flavum]
MKDDALSTLSQELRRGTVVLAALASLDAPRYGYALQQHLAEAGVEVEGNTLYPLLRRLEKQGLLTSQWNTDETRPRKFYTLTDTGHTALTALTREWHSLHTALTTLTSEGTS